jgi:ATP-binding cassette subfamily E protein 1
LCLGNLDANVYLIDEPSAFLDAEQRTNVSRIIKRHIYHHCKSCFIVEHDILMAVYLASEPTSQLIVFEEQPGEIRKSIAYPPTGLKSGMNQFLKQLDVTFSRDATNFRPKINKKYSQKDAEQRKNNTYFI